MAALRAAHEMVRAQLIPELERISNVAQLQVDSAHTDQDDPSVIIETIVGPIKARIDRTQLRDAEQLARQFFMETSRFSKRQLLKQLKGVLGVDVFPNERQIRQMLTSFTKENDAHIRSIPNRFLDDVSNLVQRRVRAGDRPVVIARDIQKRFKTGQKQAALIARDQVNKLNGALTRMRQTNLGIRQYIWRTSRDERVRTKHLDREGQTFDWDDPPDGGHPGQEVNCRCTAEPVIEGVAPPEENRREVIREVKRGREKLRERLKGTKAARLIAR